MPGSTAQGSDGSALEVKEEQSEAREERAEMAFSPGNSLFSFHVPMR